MTKEQELLARIVELEKECAYLGKQIAVQRDNRLSEFKNSLAYKLKPEFEKSGMNDNYAPDTDGECLGDYYEVVLWKVFRTLEMEGVDCARYGQ